MVRKVIAQKGSPWFLIKSHKVIKWQHKPDGCIEEKCIHLLHLDMNVFFSFWPKSPVIFMQLNTKAGDSKGFQIPCDSSSSGQNGPIGPLRHWVSSRLQQQPATAERRVLQSVTMKPSGERCRALHVCMCGSCNAAGPSKQSSLICASGLLTQTAAALTSLTSPGGVAQRLGREKWTTDNSLIEEKKKRDKTARRISSVMLTDAIVTWLHLVSITT